MKGSFHIPQVMRAAQCTSYGENINAILTVHDGIATPSLGSDAPPAGFRSAMLVRVLSVALAPGDCRVMSGMTREFQGPSSFPYTPGGDVCGVVVSAGDGSKFDVGDRIAARFVNRPTGMLGEYALVCGDVCDRVPEAISAEGAAALVSSGTVGVLIGDRIRGGDRVLIFGAGGGVGSHLCQVARLRGASYIVGVGLDPERLMEEPLCCDRAIDYTKTDPFDVEEWKDDPFDVVVDLSGGVWPALVDQMPTRQSIVKPASRNGRYLTTTPDCPIFEIHSVWGLLKTFLLPALWRAFYSRCGVYRSSLPTYSYVDGLPGTSDVVTRTFGLASEGKLVPSIDPSGPFPFTSEGVRRAFHLQKSRHAKGKVVIQVSKE